jgi:peptidoglycan hydrolase-like protein with peptidoglycan-binding domain
MAFNANVLGLTTIRRGSVGDSVAAWQRFLGAQKFPIGAADGVFGWTTDSATRSYQAKNNLGEDGIVGANTYRVALKQGLIFYVSNLTSARLLQAMNFGKAETQDLQRSLNTVLTTKPTPKYPSRPALAVDGDFGATSTRGLVEVCRQLNTQFQPTLVNQLSNSTKSKLGENFQPAMETLTEFTRRQRQRLSGPEWIKQFPASASIEDLSFPFRQYVKEFAAALKQAGAKIEITNTLRPPERAYLMHYCTKITNRSLSAGAVPPMAGVEVEWVHYTNDLSVWWANQMMAAYDIAFPPALRSNHTLGRAIDWYIEWQGTLRIQDLNGRTVEIGEPRNSFDNKQLWQVGATYGVYKLPPDPPHWSLDGY